MAKKSNKQQQKPKSQGVKLTLSVDEKEEMINISPFSKRKRRNDKYFKMPWNTNNIQYWPNQWINRKRKRWKCSLILEHQNQKLVIKII